MLLKIGSTGEDVKKLQEKLGTVVDGSFGPGTEKIVKEWQSKNGLITDGIVGDASWVKMFGNTVSQPLVLPITNFKLESLVGHVPDSVILQIPDTASKFNITNVLRLSHFLAQCSHESGNFKVTKENLNYSAEGLKKIFPKYFPGNLSESYAKQPEKIASRVYGSRLGNGDESTKEGYKFCGRGFIQLTGKSNYTSFSKFIGEDCVLNPELVSTKYPLASAAFFFDSNKIWSTCDKGSDVATITAVSKRVNGGTIGLESRIENFNEIYNLLK